MPMNMEVIEGDFKDRDPSEAPSFERLLSQVKAWVPGHLLPYLPCISFIMLKPDAYLRALVPEILAFLAANRVYPVKLAIRRLSGVELDDLYTFVKQKYWDSWWI